MYWREQEPASADLRLPDDIFDFVFRIRGAELNCDHAFALSQALRCCIDAALCERIAVHQIRMAQSGNGWIQPGDNMLLSKRSRLAIRVSREDHPGLLKLSEQLLDLAGQPLQIGEGKIRKLTPIDTLFAHAVACDVNQTESDFLQQVATELETLGIQVNKMICGTSALIATDTTDIFTRSLLIADLKPLESIALQRQGIGRDQLLGCGIFVPHKGIAAVDPG